MMFVKRTMFPLVSGLLTALLMSGCSFLDIVQGTYIDLAGSWEYKSTGCNPLVLSFRKDMTFEVDFDSNGTRDIWGRYELYADRIKFIDAEDECTTDCQEWAMYEYAIKGRELRFRLLADECRPRKYALSLTWQRVR